MERNWYVIHTYSNCENKVKANLERIIEVTGMQDKIFSIVVPVKEEIKVKNGERKIVKKKIFPGYVFVEMVMTNDSWYLIRRTDGVTGFLGIGKEPYALTENEMSRIFRVIEGKEQIFKTGWDIGQGVQILSGPFADLIGRITEVNYNSGKLKVLLSLFERETKVELEFSHVEKI